MAVNEQKRNASDFALWKFSPKDHQRDMEWDSPWGKGFPGWHIECSAMSMAYLGDTLDIHTGGIDHIPVHHTNEIAQSEAATGKRFANYWMHSNHVMVNGDKISKSLGNGIRLQTIVEQGIPAEAVRLHVLESHYRSQSQFSHDSLVAAHNRLKNWQAVAVLRYQPVKHDGAHAFDFGEATNRLIELLSNDLDTPSALAFVSQLFTQLETALVTEEFAGEFVSSLSHSMLPLAYSSWTYQISVTLSVVCCQTALPPVRAKIGAHLIPYAIPCKNRASASEILLTAKSGTGCSRWLNK